jgi:hypothetical protein
MPPRIDGFTPVTGRAGDTITINGANFRDVTGVRIGGTSVSFTRVSDFVLQAIVSSGVMTGPIEVFTLTGSARSAQAFVVIMDTAPVITDFSPGSGPRGTQVQIRGMRLSTPPVVVRFNGAIATLESVTPTVIFAFVPGDATDGPISVTTGAGMHVSAASFDVMSAIDPQVDPDDIPAITAVDPPRAAVLTNVAINGVRFDPPAKPTDPLPKLPTPVVFFFDGNTPIPAAIRSFNNTTIQSRVPNGAKTGLVQIINTKGIPAFIPGEFTVLPTITDFNPKKGQIGTAVKVTGTGLYNTPRFFFRGENDSDIEAPFSDPTLESILVAVPEGALTGKIKVITKGGGTASTATDFVVQAATPQIGSFSPKQAKVGDKVSIFAAVVNGKQTKFESIQSVSFLKDPNGVGPERRIVLGKGTFTVSGDRTRIDVRVPDGAVSGKLRVTNESGSDSTGRLEIPLKPPAGLAAKSVAGSNRIVLSWRDTTTTETGFKLERRTGDGAYALLTTLPENSNMHADDTVMPGVTYTYQLRAFNTKDPDSDPSNEASATAGGALMVAPNRLAFMAPQDGANPAAQQLSITSSGMPVNWMATTSVPWLSVMPASGATPMMAMVIADIFGIKAGSYPAVITVRSTGGDAAVVTVPVELTVTKRTAPAITGIQPSAGPPGTQVVISGSDLMDVTAVQIGTMSVPFTADPAASTVAIVIPADAAQDKVTVTTASGSATFEQPFVVTPPGTGVMLAASPVSRAMAEGASTTYEIALNRNGVAAAIDLDVTDLPFGVMCEISPNPAPGDRATLTVRATEGSATPGATIVTVRGAVTDAPGVIVTPAGVALSIGVAPVITGFEPAEGAPGMRVEITGSNLERTRMVTFNGVPATGLAVIDDNRIAATVPATTTGVIGVATDFGSAMSGRAFPIIGDAKLRITAMPALQKVVAGQSVSFDLILERSGIWAPATLSLDAMPAGTTARIDPNPILGDRATLVVSTVAGTPLGTGSVIVSGRAASIVASPISVSVTVVAPAPPPPQPGPTITGFLPESGAPGTLVTVAGSGFVAGMTATMFNGTPAATTVQSPNLLVATVPPRASTGPIAVTVNGRTAVSSMPFLVVVAKDKEKEFDGKRLKEKEFDGKRIKEKELEAVLPSAVMPADRLGEVELQVAELRHFILEQWRPDVAGSALQNANGGEDNDKDAAKVREG